MRILKELISKPAKSEINDKSLSANSRTFIHFKPFPMLYWISTFSAKAECIYIGYYSYVQTRRGKLFSVDNSLDTFQVSRSLFLQKI